MCNTSINKKSPGLCWALQKKGPNIEALELLKLTISFNYPRY